MTNEHDKISETTPQREYPFYAKIDENTRGSHCTVSIQGDNIEEVHKLVVNLYTKLKQSLKEYEQQQA